MKPLRVLLADDHALVRAGLRSLVASLPNVEVIAEAGDGREALRLVAEHRPDVALLDISMAGLNGLEVAARIAQDHPTTRVIMLSMHASEEHVIHALKAGAGYLLKDGGLAELDLALRAAARGETYVCPAVSRHVTDYLRRQGPGSGPLDRLTPRQREVLQLVAEGKTTKQIANILHISVKTVETHRAQLMQALDIHDVAGLVRYAVRAGVVSGES